MLVSQEDYIRISAVINEIEMAMVEDIAFNLMDRELDKSEMGGVDIFA